MTVKLSYHSLGARIFDPGRAYLATEVAEILKVPRQNLATWRHKSKGLPFVKLSR